MATETVYKSGEWTYEEYKKLAIAAKEDIQALRSEIYDEVVTNEPLLANLNSPSATALYKLWINIWAFMSWLLVSNWVRYEAKIKEAGRAAIPHNTYWYAQRSKDFQLGDVLDASTGAVIYPVIDETKKIVKAASIKEADGRIIIKVAKLVGANLVAFSPTELLAFEGYINQIKDAGVVTQIISQNSDLLKFAAQIFYNPIIPLQTVQANVEAAIYAYLKNIPFDGIFRRNDLIAAIRSVEGVKDVKIVALEATTNYVITPFYAPIDVLYETVAGYISIDPNFPLSAQLTYLP